MTAAIVRGSIITMDPQRPRAEAMAIAGGRITAVGSLAEARLAAGAGAREYGFDRGAVVPGLIDTHNHMHWTGIQSKVLDISRCTDIAQVQAAIREYAARNPQAAWITSGSGWHVANLAEQTSSNGSSAWPTPPNTSATPSISNRPTENSATTASVPTPPLKPSVSSPPMPMLSKTSLKNSY